MVLQRLAEAGDLARPFTEYDWLVEVMAFQMAADEMDIRAQQLQQLQAQLRGHAQLVELGQRLVELAGGLAKVGLGQAGQPVTQRARARLAEGQRLPARCGNT